MDVRKWIPLVTLAFFKLCFYFLIVPGNSTLLQVYVYSIAELYTTRRNSEELCGTWPIRLLCPWYFPGKNTGVSCRFLTQGLYPYLLSLLHFRQILYHQRHLHRQGIKVKWTLTLTLKQSTLDLVPKGFWAQLLTQAIFSPPFSPAQSYIHSFIIYIKWLFQRGCS